MNMANKSTRFSGFQLHLGHSPHLIPPFVAASPTLLASNPHADAKHTASKTITCLITDVAEAKDNLLLMKITQSHHADKSRGPDHPYHVNDLVMLSTQHQ
jgi:hypothetical protein